jgi:hypothetical protein
MGKYTPIAEAQPKIGLQVQQNSESNCNDQPNQKLKAI